MAYKYTQAQPVNYLLMGAKKGWCLRNVMQAFGGVAEGYHPSATYELGKTVLHKEAPPQGVAVPVWWDTGVKDGHVNISTGDGRLCNDGQFVNYADFAKKYKLLGWGETICGRRIISIEIIPDPIPEPAPVPTPAPTPEIKVGDSVTASGAGTADSYGGGAKTKNFPPTTMKVIRINNGRYALNQYNSGTVGKVSDVTGWWTKEQIS